MLRMTFGGIRTDPSKNGAPRPMKMGTIRSPWRYDAVADVIIAHAVARLDALFSYHAATPRPGRDAVTCTHLADRSAAAITVHIIRRDDTHLASRY